MIFHGTILLVEEKYVNKITENGRMILHSSKVLTLYVKWYSTNLR